MPEDLENLEEFNKYAGTGMISGEASAMKRERGTV